MQMIKILMGGKIVKDENCVFLVTTNIKYPCCGHLTTIALPWEETVSQQGWFQGGGVNK